MNTVVPSEAAAPQRGPPFTFSSAVHLLRYGKAAPGAPDYTWHSRARIAQLLQVKYHAVCISLHQYEECTCEKRERARKRPRSILVDE